MGYNLVVGNGCHCSMMDIEQSITPRLFDKVSDPIQFEPPINQVMQLSLSHRPFIVSHHDDPCINQDLLIIYIPNKCDSVLFV